MCCKCWCYGLMTVLYPTDIYRSPECYWISFCDPMFMATIQQWSRDGQETSSYRPCSCAWHVKCQVWFLHFQESEVPSSHNTSAIQLTLWFRTQDLDVFGDWIGRTWNGISSAMLFSNGHNEMALPLSAALWGPLVAEFTQKQRS